MTDKYEAPKLEEMVRLSDIQGRIDAAVMVEREECAKVADEESLDCCWRCDCGEHHSKNVAAAIRARGGK
jgi:hypothetical protein